MSHPVPRTNIRRAAFTLVELLVVLVVLAVLAAIVLPRFVNSTARAKEARMKTDLRLIRGAVERFHNDTGAYPALLSDLVKPAAPAQGKDSSGNNVPINASDWHGPYLQSLPKDPISGAGYSYDAATPGRVGEVKSSAPNGATATDGTSIKNW